MTVTKSIVYVGVNDHDLDLFEGQYIVPEGMAYNSYVICGEKTAVMDSVEAGFADEWLANIARVLGDAAPDYLIVQHMEPDHSGSIMRFAQAYPAAVIVSSAKAFTLLGQFFGADVVAALEPRMLTIKEGGTLDLGGHVLRFIAAPFVHWPEVMMTYDETEAVFFAADAFGKFGAVDADVEEDDEDDDEDPRDVYGWACEARRYYFGIVGKYGKQVQNLLAKLEGLTIKHICPLHGPVLSQNLDYYVGLYQTWSSYGVESDGIAIAYASVYGHTREAALYLANKLEAAGCPKVAVSDLCRDDMAEVVEDAFRYGKLVLVSVTLNADMFPAMKTFIDHLLEHDYQKRTVAFVENGSWGPVATRNMKAKFADAKAITFAQTEPRIMGALNDESRAQLDALAEELA